MRKREIWKFPFEVSDEVLISMPVGAEILCVQTQRGMPCLWAVVDRPPKAMEFRKIYVRGTGHSMGAIDDDGVVTRYIGTIQLLEGSLVFHVFAEVVVVAKGEW